MVTRRLLGQDRIARKPGRVGGSPRQHRLRDGSKRRDVRPSWEIGRRQGGGADTYWRDGCGIDDDVERMTVRVEDLDRIGGWGLARGRR